MNFDDEYINSQRVKADAKTKRDFWSVMTWLCSLALVLCVFLLDWPLRSIMFIPALLVFVCSLRYVEYNDIYKYGKR